MATSELGAVVARCNDGEPTDAPAPMDWIQALTAPPLDELTRTELVLPQHANPYGTLFAPEALSMLGKTALLAAMRFSRQAVVMAASREIRFLKPVAVGSRLHLHARVVRVGRSSMTLDVHAAVETAPGTRPQVALQGSFEMVAVDASGEPVAIEPPNPVSRHAPGMSEP